MCLEFRVVLSVLVIVTVWAQWPAFAGLLLAWQGDGDYSAGQLVPLVAVFLVWRDRRMLRQCLLVPHWWAGMGVLLLAQTTTIYGVLSFRMSLERYGVILTMAGLVLLVAGRQLFRRLSWILLFLLLMVPLPGRIHSMISLPLQRLATTGAVFLLEALGARVSQDGNIVTLAQNIPIAVAEACSGLRLLTAFVIVAAFIAYMVKRPRWQKGILILSSIPVAVICNIVRIFLTAMIMLHVSVEIGQKFFHDLAGLLMMPIAVSLLFGELWLMDKIVKSDSEPAQRCAIVRGKSVKSARA